MNVQQINGYVGVLTTSGLCENCVRRLIKPGLDVLRPHTSAARRRSKSDVPMYAEADKECELICHGCKNGFCRSGWDQTWLNPYRKFPFKDPRMERSLAGHRPWMPCWRRRGGRQGNAGACSWRTVVPESGCRTASAHDDHSADCTSGRAKGAPASAPARKRSCAPRHRGIAQGGKVASSQARTGDVHVSPAQPGGAIRPLAITPLAPSIVTAQTASSKPIAPPPFSARAIRAPWACRAPASPRS